MKTEILISRNSPSRVAGITLFIAAAMAATVPLSASPGKQVPFQASFVVEFQSTIPNPITHVWVRGQGQAQHMGRSETFTDNEVVNTATGEGHATFTVIGANGDTLVFEDTFQTTPPGPGGFTFAGTYKVLGGTGRFAGATGTGLLTGSAHFTDDFGNGAGEFTFDGTITAPGK